MELEVIDSTQLGASRKTTPTISLNPTSGLIQLNAAAMKVIKYKEGDKILLSWDKKQKDDWFIYISDHANAMQFRTAKEGKYLHINSTNVVRKLLGLIDLDNEVATFRIGEEPAVNQGNKLYPIFTVKNLRLDRSKSD